MILGPDGKPARPPRTFETPRWLKDEVCGYIEGIETARKIAELQESVDALPRVQIGDTVRVRLPRRRRLTSCRASR
jgi:hypothetical protein